MSRVHVPLGSISKLILVARKAKLNATKRLRQVFKQNLQIAIWLADQWDLKALKQIMAISSPDDVRYVSMDTPFLHSNEVFNKQKTIAVAIDPIQKFIYFLTYLSKGDECRSCLPIIARVNLDGTGYKTIISSGIGHSEGLALDYHNQEGFWAGFSFAVLWLAVTFSQSYCFGLKTIISCCIGQIWNLVTLKWLPLNAFVTHPVAKIRLVFKLVPSSLIGLFLKLF